MPRIPRPGDFSKTFERLSVILFLLDFILSLLLSKVFCLKVMYHVCNIMMYDVACSDQSLVIITRGRVILTKLQEKGPEIYLTGVEYFGSPHALTTICWWDILRKSFYRSSFDGQFKVRGRLKSAKTVNCNFVSYEFEIYVQPNGKNFHQ